MNEVNKDVVVEKIEYLSNMPHSALVEHCVYLENENDSYKAQKYITDFISENGIICEKNKEIENLKRINEEHKKLNGELRKEIDGLITIIDLAKNYINKLKNFKIKYVMLEEKELYASEKDFVKDLLEILERVNEE